MVLLPQEYRARTLSTNTIWELPVSSDWTRTSFGLEVNQTYTKTEIEWESIFPVFTWIQAPTLMKLIRIPYPFQFLLHILLYHTLVILLTIAFYWRGFPTIFTRSLDLDMCFIILSESHNLCETLSFLQSLKYLCLPTIVKCWWSSRYSWICKWHVISRVGQRWH